MASITGLPLSDGRSVPQLGFGTMDLAAPGKIGEGVKAAIDVGYRHIDCAPLYRNEKEVGEAIQQKIKEGIVKREDVFITSKIWNTHHSKERVAQSVEKTLNDLQTSYVDLMLVHTPMGFEEGDQPFPVDAEGMSITTDVDYLETWAALEEAHKAGQIKSIGVSNFNSKQIQRVLDNCTVQPVVNQVEVHPYFNNDRLIKFCKEKGLVVTAYSPFGNPARPWAKADDPNLLEDQKVKEIAESHGKTPAQVLIRFAIQRGVAVIPKSATPSRISSNFDVQNFELSEDDMTALMSMDRPDGRIVKFSNVSLEYPFHPFKEEF